MHGRGARAREECDGWVFARVKRAVGLVGLQYRTTRRLRVTGAVISTLKRASELRVRLEVRHVL